MPVVAFFAITIFGLWHIYTAHNARFGSKHSAVELMGDFHSNEHDKQTDSLVQEALNRTLESDNQILHKLEELQLENELLRIRTGQIMRHIADSITQWKPLRDLTKISVRCFISEIMSREHEQEGPPELFEFPSALSHGRHLCFKGNDTQNGTRNFYTFAWEEALPSGHLLLNGTTLISETEYDYNNPWHSMCNLIQFVHWKLKNRCTSKAERLIIYHWSELRRTMGGWITQVRYALLKNFAHSVYR